MKEKQRQQPLAALREHRRLKDLRKGAILRIGLRKMIKRNLKTGNFSVVLCSVSGRGWKPVRIETVEEVVTAVVEKASSSIHSSASG
ncbi:hypothetical protein TNCV_571621 [Trichonephila clavipes]|nr:hypothetical protein TNCV_571621 [Trichonephila clavipes]